MPLLFRISLDRMTTHCQLITLTIPVKETRTPQVLTDRPDRSQTTDQPLGHCGTQSRACRPVIDDVRTWRFLMSIIARPRPAGRSPCRLLRPLSPLGVAAVPASLLAACSSSGGSSQTLVI